MLSQIVAEMEAEEQDVQKDTAPQTTGTSSEPRSKTKKSDRARGDRGRNRFPQGTSFKITLVIYIRYLCMAVL